MSLEGLSERDQAILRSIFDPTVTIGDVADDGDSFLEEDEDSSETHVQAKELCSQGVKLAEVGQLEAALNVLNESINVAPDRAAGYNDRAQLFRLLERDDEALQDLQKALDITEGKKTRARALALCQRGVLLRKKGSDDEAKTAFAEAAKLGSAFARKQVVEMNPYAALCNQMLSQVMRGEKEIKL